MNRNKIILTIFPQRGEIGLKFERNVVKTEQLDI